MVSFRPPSAVLMINDCSLMRQEISSGRGAEQHLFRTLIMHQHELSCSGGDSDTHAQLNLTNWVSKPNFLHWYNKVIKQLEED